jgi:hypothetical protein
MVEPERDPVFTNTHQCNAILRSVSAAAGKQVDLPRTAVIPRIEMRYGSDPAAADRQERGSAG